ncbi:HET-domain-containing protein [Lophiostoma macrostomum CBS 122681]|uniref:HET-domain-containing protein n=1 Tax=Lophiostoma macrostomum CBS 122681 TaxID=1314788 RepID=A0A6A6TA21_9PLEO|nr:HET-domain-containing protein [Lophiostoma macrostomum CBS 122681]
MSLSSASICKACAKCLSQLSVPCTREKIEWFLGFTFPWSPVGPPKASYQHLNVDSVHQAASEGCHLCLYIKLMDHEGCCKKASQVPFFFHASGSRATRTLLIDHECGNKQSFRLMYFPISIKVKASEILDASIFGESTQSAHCQALASGWMHSCNASHSRCAARLKKMTNLESSQLPTRLLDLQGAHMTPYIRLVHTKTEKINDSYVTLSHCWGAKQLIKLTTANIEQFSRNIEIRSLPQTFRDVIEVCGWYNLRYIWIDSLCIIQDSEADWNTESAAMKSVYSNGILNIAASSAVDSSCGLFARRPPHLKAPLVLDVPKRGARVLHITMDTLSRSITDGPLASRGWVLQEWLLAPRVLHFGKQLFWECPEMLACETYPQGSPDRSLIPEPYLFALKNSVSSVISTPDSQLTSPQEKAGVYQAWRDICGEYSRRDLSVGSDKIVALSGVANLFQSILKDTYMTGSWKSTFISDMCWVVASQRRAWHSLNVGRQTYSMKPARPPEYGAPSWSWMSVSDQIFWSKRDRSQELAVLCWPNRSRSHNEPISPQRNFVTVLGVLRPVKWKLIPINVGTHPKFQLFWDGFEAFEFVRWRTIWLDDLGAKSFPSEEIFFLPLLISGYLGSSIEGVILCQAGRNHYRRIGYFNLDEYGVLGALFFELKSPATRLRHPWNHFRKREKKINPDKGPWLFDTLFGQNTPDVSDPDQSRKPKGWQVQDIQQALGPYDESKFRPLEVQEIQIV